MLNMIRADFYRLAKTRGFWITQIVIIAFLFMTVSSSTMGHVGVSSQDSIEQIDKMYEMRWDGATAVSAIQTMGEFLLYFILPLLVFVIGNDFSKETYKNILTVGVSRYKYFFSKLVSFIIVLIFQLIMVYMTSFITGTIFNGAGDITMEFLTDTLKIMSIQILFLVAITIMSSLLLFVTKSNIISVISTLVLPLVIVILHSLNPDVNLFDVIDFHTGLKQAISLDITQLKSVIIGAVSSIILGNILITQVFKRQEL